MGSLQRSSSSLKDPLQLEGPKYCKLFQISSKEPPPLNLKINKSLLLNLYLLGLLDKNLPK